MSRIRVIAVQLWSTTSASPDNNRAHALDMLERAASEKPDLVVLPEAVAMLCYPDGRADFSYFDVAENIPGPTTDEACRIAATYGVNVVIGLIEKRESGGQNLAIVIDRKGTIIGQYEKVHEPEVCRLEQQALVGSDIPVFDLDFGRVGIFICWDLNYPELPSILAAKGADVLLFPHLMSLPNDGNFAISVRARAIETGLPVVAAGMRDAHNHNGTQEGIGPTCVLDGDGSVLAQSLKARADLVSADLDLGSDNQNRRRVRRFRKDVRPDLYIRSWSSRLDPDSEESTGDN